MADYLNIAGRIRTTASDGVAMEAQEVKDLNLNKSQQEVNADVQTDLSDRYTKEETYNREELNELITTPDVNRVYVIATNLTTAVTDLLPATGSSDTLYNVGNWNGTQYDTTVYSIYGWDGTAYVCLAVRSSIGEVYDISANHPDGQGNPTPYADLAAAIGTGGANVPAGIRRGGMSIKFIQGTVQSSDNKYVQYRLMAQSFTIDVTQWQGVDDEPILLSKNIVESGGIAKYVEPLMTFDGLHIRKGALTSSGIMVEVNVSSHVILSIKAGDIIVINKGQNNGFLCFLKNYVEVLTDTNFNSYICDGYSRREFGQLTTLTAPSDAKFLYVTVSDSGTDVVPSVLTVNGIDYINGLYTQVSRIQENTDRCVDVAKYLSNDMTFNSIVRELYVLGIAYSDIKYYSVTYANGIYALHLIDETHLSLINFSINSKGIQKIVIAQSPIGSLVEAFVLIDNDKLKVIPETPVTLNYGNNLYYAPSILSHILIENENSLRQIDLTNNSVGYVNANGTITNHANSRYCDSVSVKKGDIIRVHASETDGAYVISYCDEVQSTFEPIVPYSGVDNDDYLFISQKDGFVTISWHNSFTTYATIISSKVYGELIGNGKSAYQIAVDNGFEGTEQEWLDSLKGDDGAPGTPGIRGEQGLQGNSGYSGAVGELEVVNNLTDGGATKALSAEQGKIIGNYIDYNNIPIIPKRVNPESISIIKAEPSNWTNLDADGTVSSSKVSIYDEVYGIYRDCVELNDNNSGRFAASFPAAIDFSNKVLRMSVCLQKDLDVTKLQPFAVLLFSDGQTDANHRAQFTEQYANPTEAGGTYNLQYVRGGWFHFCVNPQPILSSVGSSFDITNVTAVGIHVNSTEAVKIYVDEVSVVRTMLQKGIINIVDNFDPNVPNMADYAFSKGVKLNLSIVPNWIGGSASASLAEINRCKRQGHFIFNHTFNHITDVSGLTEQQIVEEITKSNSWMVSNGFARGAKCISNPSAAFPFSKYKAYMESPADIIFHHWTTMPSSGKLLYYPYYPMSRLLTISALDSNSSNHTEAQATLQRMKMAIDTADTYGGIAVIGSHGTFWLADDGETWKELIDYIATKTDMINFGIDDVVEGNFV